MQWSIFCRVVDNFGDVGVAWRLAADLAARGEQVRLAIDDASALAWMAPGGGVEVAAWDDGEAMGSDVWVETFGCGWPDAAARRLRAMPAPPVCIDLEHLSAEAFVARSHGLPLPRFDDAGKALPSWCFYPGFDARTGGLLREPGLLERRRLFDRAAWFRTHGLALREGERCVVLFCYTNAALPALLAALSDRPTLLLTTPGPATVQTEAVLGRTAAAGRLRAVSMPFQTQTDFDALLWAADLNVVRGEDSFVRAMWAGAPFLWQAYPQDDGAEAAKVEAFVTAFLADAPERLARPLRALYARWNGIAAGSAATTLTLPDAADWAAASGRWCDGLAARPDLVTSLLGFVASKR